MIESLHSPHVTRVKALIGSRGKKERRDTGLFVAEGIQFLREASNTNVRPKIETLYLTQSGREKVHEAGLNVDHLKVFDVSDEVMHAMGETVTPQGILGICRIPMNDGKEIEISEGTRIVFLHEIQDPGNAGAILRTADATGFTELVTSPESVDLYSPKVVRASAGSLWHLPVYERVDVNDLIDRWPNENVFSLDANGANSLLDVNPKGASLWIFGNEARGTESLPKNPKIRTVRIPMAGNAESLNLASAAAIVLFRVTSAS